MLALKIWQIDFSNKVRIIPASFSIVKYARNFMALSVDESMLARSARLCRLAKVA